MTNLARIGGNSSEFLSLIVVRVLLVDDHLVVRQGLEQLFAQTPGFSVVGSVATADDALQLVKQLSPDIVVADYSLPGHSAIWFLERLSEQKISTPVLVLSMHRDYEVILSCMQAGARAYLAKTADHSELCEAIRAVVRGGTYLHPNLAMGVLRHASRPPGREEALTTREREILLMMAHGKSNQDIADLLFLSISTVKSHIRNLFHKLEVEDRTQALTRALKLGHISMGDLDESPESFGPVR